jgi:hypothetical protein
VAHDSGLLIVWDFQLKELVEEYASGYHLHMEAAECRGGYNREQVQRYLQHHAAEISNRVFLIGQTMLLASLSESTDSQKATLGCYRAASGFAFGAIAGLLTGTIASLKQVSLF